MIGHFAVNSARTQELNYYDYRYHHYYYFIIIIPVIIFMQGIYNYIPETNYVSRVYSIAAILCLQFGLYVMLFHP